ncbi:tetratricopeptide repeat protein [Dysgonomonas sp. HDW5B]|uniref:tetratricopeptide repeat protein n=1 Tax=Dysgonomonas sp. HDW5B TaxID=2714927 RepID=UPI00140E846B|nr:tetratricopeptide repeat protein [Dysgonomonas sp. HDW5B]QIK54815.1 tetratricopeptide repeat protein [Dysgonomonas sp. HDW5B]
MTEEEAKLIFDEGNEADDNQEFEKAIEHWGKIPQEHQLYYDAQWNIGIAHKDLKNLEKAIEYWTKIPREHQLYYEAQWNIGIAHKDLKNLEKTIEYWTKIPREDNSYYKAQLNIGSTYKDLEEFEKAIEYWEKIPTEHKLYYKTQLNIGVSYYNSEKFEKAIEFWTKIPREDNSYHRAQLNIGLAYDNLESFEKAIEYWMEIPRENEAYYKTQWIIALTYIQLKHIDEASKAFINSKKDIFEMLPIFKFIKISIIKKIFSQILDSKTDDFFNTTIKEDIDNKEKYKEIFIKSLYIINLLHVDSDQEKQVAHYTRKWVAEQMLFAKSPLRLSTVIGANDPKEGITLLDFLEINKGDKLQTPYQAFITCFTFNHESLNQFRLYGKEDNREATGISIIVNRDFFSDSVSLNISHANNEQSKELSIAKNDKITEEEIKKPSIQKYSLYRCIYIDPKTKKIISVGHKEIDCFYREIKNNKPQTFTESKKLIKGINDYQKEIGKKLKQVKDQLKQLNCYIRKHKTDLNESIISELLLPLRHLTKHAAFKEEQECRIFDIENLNTSDIISPKRDGETCTFNTMHIDYEADLSDYVEKVIFAPMTPELEQFEAFSKYKGYNFPCERCDHPFSMKTT